jgi:hypothetical protein
MGFKDYGFGYRNVILMREHSGTFILGKTKEKEMNIRRARFEAHSLRQ